MRKLSYLIALFSLFLGIASAQTSEILPNENLAAHNLYLQGRYHLNQRTEEGLRKALDFFEKSLVEDAEIAGPLVDWKAAGSTLEYLGTEEIDGTQAHKVKVVRKDGDVTFVYLDPDHFLEIRILTQRVQQGALVETETDLGDYEKINGVFVPTSIDAGSKGDSDKQKIVIDKAEGNVPVDDAIFHFPTTPAK